MGFGKSTRSLRWRDLEASASSPLNARSVNPVLATLAEDYFTRSSPSALPTDPHQRHPHAAFVARMLWDGLLDQRVFGSK